MIKEDQIVFETDRLYAVPLSEDDLENIKDQLQDPDVMYAWEGAFSDLMVQSWLANQLERYKMYGFAYNGIRLKSDDTFIGQCGVTMQEVEGRMVHEVGYMLSKRFWKGGFAVEMASACVDYAFDKLKAPFACSIVRDTNEPSIMVAKRLGMTERTRIIKHYRGFTMPHIVFAIERADWEAAKASGK